MAVIDAGIDDGDRHAAARGQRPRFGRVDICIWFCEVEAELSVKEGEALEVLPGIVERPLFVEVEIARHKLGAWRMRQWLRQAADEIWLRIQHVGIVAIACDCRRLGATRHGRELQAGADNFRLRSAAALLADVRQLSRWRSRQA